jgi:uncharacterized protein YraI
MGLAMGRRARVAARRLALTGAVVAPLILALGGMALAQTTAPTPTPTAAAHTAAGGCPTGCVGYAYVELNLRAAPDQTAAVLAFVPKGERVLVTGAPERNGYAEVVYQGKQGWVIALGVVATPEEVSGGPADPEATAAPAPTTAPAPAPPTPAPAPAANARVALVPLLLRAGPDPTAAAILTIPEGATVFLTGEGAENGYVTVDYGGTTGWAYAELLGGEPGA